MFSEFENVHKSTFSRIICFSRSICKTKTGKMISPKQVVIHNASTALSHLKDRLRILNTACEVTTEQHHYPSATFRPCTWCCLMCVKAKKHHQTCERHFTAMTNKIFTSIINFFICSEFYDSSNNGQFISSMVPLMSKRHCLWV